ncbi:MAG: hypothetical protein AAF702_20940 [Chloroflexota bacterium]
MLFWIGLILGIIIGWIIEWVLDWWFWRGDIAEIGTVLASPGPESSPSDVATIEELSQVAMPSEGWIEASSSVETSSVAHSSMNDLKKIKGIGKVYEGMLNQGGIYNFSQLAALTPEKIQQLIGPENWQNIDSESWIEQAQQYAINQEGSR